MRDGGQGARISFPEALQLANRCWCGSDARFYCQRPDWLRVPKSKYQHTRLRVSSDTVAPKLRAYERAGTLYRLL